MRAQRVTYVGVRIWRSKIRFLMQANRTTFVEIRFLSERNEIFEITHTDLEWNLWHLKNVNFPNVNFAKNVIAKCEFSQKCDLQNVNFFRKCDFQTWILPKMWFYKKNSFEAPPIVQNKRHFEKSWTLPIGTSAESKSLTMGGKNKWR